MKKNEKLVFGLLSAAAVAGGAYYFVKKFLNKDSEDDFDDFEDNFEVFDFDDEEDDDVSSENREYVTLNMPSATEENIATETEDVFACESNEESTEASMIEEETEEVLTEDILEEEVFEEITEAEADVVDETTEE